MKKPCLLPASSAETKSWEDSKRSKGHTVSPIALTHYLYDIDGSSYAFTLLKMENMSPPVEDLGQEMMSYEHL